MPFLTSSEEIDKKFGKKYEPLRPAFNELAGSLFKLDSAITISLKTIYFTITLGDKLIGTIYFQPEYLDLGLALEPFLSCTGFYIYPTKG